MKYLDKKKLAFISIANNVQSILPSLYQQTEYIEGSGTQYIDTGFIANQDTTVQMEFALTSIPVDSASSVCLFGHFGTSPSIYAARISDSSLLYYYGADNATVFGPTTPDLKKHTVLAEKNKIYYDDVLKITRTKNDFACSHSLSLLAQHGTTSYSRIANAKIYSCKIYSDTEPVRDFVPCYRKSDNTIGLYDLVNDVFYTNAGTGVFLKGEDV